jgi:hypothetical protein
MFRDKLSERQQKRVHMAISMKAVNGVYEKIMQIMAETLDTDMTIEELDLEKKGWQASTMYWIGILHEMKYTAEDLEKFLNEESRDKILVP